MARVTVLRTGAMGLRMARNLLAAGQEVTVWNRTPAALAPLVVAGARAAHTPRAAVAAAEFAIKMLRDDRASALVWLDEATGTLAGMAPGGVAIESATLTTRFMRDLAARFAAAGVDFLDAPVVGSRPQAEVRGK